MRMTLEAVYELVMQLSAEERSELKLRLQDDAPTLHPAWGPELRRRAAEMDSGEVKMIPWDEVCAEVDNILNENERSDA